MNQGDLLLQFLIQKGIKRIFCLTQQMRDILQLIVDLEVICLTNSLYDVKFTSFKAEDQIEYKLTNEDIVVVKESEQFDLKVMKYSNKLYVIEDIAINDLSKHTCYRYENYYEEAKAILNYAKKVDTLYVASDKEILYRTMSALSNHSIDRANSDIMFWAICAKALSAPYTCSIEVCDCIAHPLVSAFSSKYSAMHNLPIDKDYKDVLKSWIAKIDRNKKYAVNELWSVLYDFVTFLTKGNIPNILDSFNVNWPDMTIKEYANSLSDMVNLEIQESTVKKINNILYIPIDTLSIYLPKNIWVAGLNNLSALSRSIYAICNLKKCILSFSAYENGKIACINPVLSECTIVEQNISTECTVHRSNYNYPAPPISSRPKEIAINHITKLMNDPYVFYIECIMHLRPRNAYLLHWVGMYIHNLFEEVVVKWKQFETQKDLNEYLTQTLIAEDLSDWMYILVYTKMRKMASALWSVVSDKKHVQSEVEGSISIIHEDNEYILHGRADIIYGNESGKYGVIDFKTGITASWACIASGKDPQMALEMLILVDGGFGMKTDTLLASGFISPREFIPVIKENLLINSARDGLKKLLQMYWKEEQVYFAANFGVDYAYLPFMREYGVYCEKN